MFLSALALAISYLPLAHVRWNNMIQVKNLSKDFGQVMAVSDIGFDIDKGEIVGFLGRNGAGKTTTIRILTTYLPATSGVARVAGYDVMTQSMEVRQNIGYLPESVPLYADMRVEEYLDYRAKLRGVDRSQRARRIADAMERCRVREVRRRLIGTLSRGYRQRVGLADSLSHEPAILIMDEPTSGLDPLQIRETLQTIKQLSERHTILFSTHILAEVEAICQRMIVIHKGRLLVDGKISELVRDDARILVAEVRGPAGPVRAALQAIDGVTGITAGELADGWLNLEIRFMQKIDLRERVFSEVVKNHWMLRRLDVRRRKLDEYFYDLVDRTDRAEIGEGVSGALAT
jgi:ABC-2 type transport system ATP-binding protein